MKKVINFNFKNMAEFCEQTNPVDLQLTLESFRNKRTCCWIKFIFCDKGYFGW